MNSGDEIDAAIRELTLVDAVIRLGADAAAKIVANAEHKFVVEPGFRWWWEHIRPELPRASRLCSADDGYLLLPVVCPDQEVLLFASDDEDPPWPVYRGLPPDLSRVIAECRAFEYIVADPQLAWLVIENHHAELIAIGEPVASSLARIDG